MPAQRTARRYVALKFTRGARQTQAPSTLAYRERAQRKRRGDDAALSSWREGLSIPRQVGLLASGLAVGAYPIQHGWRVHASGYSRAFPSVAPTVASSPARTWLEPVRVRMIEEQRLPGYSGASASASHRFPWRFPRAARVATSRVLVMRLYRRQYSERHGHASSEREPFRWAVKYYSGGASSVVIR